MIQRAHPGEWADNDQGNGELLSKGWRSRAWIKEPEGRLPRIESVMGCSTMQATAEQRVGETIMEGPLLEFDTWEMVERGKH